MHHTSHDLICPRCKGDNPRNSRFCGHCGAALEVACGSCGTANPAAFRFCGQCGLPLDSPGAAEAAPKGARDPGAARAERRQITILFCDLVGSTAISQRLDPEQLRDLLSEYRQAAAGTIEEFGGQVARLLGDGILAYFGYPVAHGNDAVRALRAGLGIVRRMTSLAGKIQARFGVDAQVRIGVHTGVVVIGDLATGSIFERMSVVGEAPNIAARLQEVARPNSVVAGALTARLTGGHVLLRSLGKLLLKGAPTPLEAFEALEDGSADAPGHVIEPLLTRLYGREAEWQSLWDRWTLAAAGRGQVVCIGGEGGIGKSRLLRELRDRLADVDHTWIDWIGSPFADKTAFAPVVAALKRALAADADGAEAPAAARLEVLLGEAAAAIPEAVPLLGEILGYDPAGSLIESWTPLRKRRRTLDSLAAWVLALARRKPVVLAVEDLHWIDDSTTELLDALVRQVPSVPLLCVVTHRPQVSPIWQAEPGVASIPLAPLSDRDVDGMIGDMTARKPLASAALRAIAAKADGVPLYVEELTRTVLDREMNAPEASAASALPATLRDSLMERLDRLSSPKSILQSAAVIGRNFAFGTVRDLVGAGGESLEGDLDALVRAGILFQRGFPPNAVYTFKHSLLRDAAYDSLLMRQRGTLHGRLADLYRDDPIVAGEQPELVAFHLAAGGRHEEAAGYFARAGKRALERAAYREALEHVDAGLAELAPLPPSPDRSARELALHIDRGAVLIALRGYGAAEVGREYEAAYALCGGGVSSESTYSALWGLGAHLGVHGPLERARELTGTMIEIADAIGDPLRQGEANRRQGLIAFMLGDMLEAGRYYARARQQFARATNPSAALLGRRPYPLFLNNQAWLSWYLGKTAEAHREIEEALALSRRLNDSYSLAFALGIRAAIGQLDRDVAAVKRACDECLSIAAEQYFPYWQAWAEIFGGWAGAIGGDDAGLAMLERGLRAYTETGAIQLELCALTLFAEALLVHGRAAEAWSALERVQIEKSGTAKYFTAEMWRIKANCARALGQDEAATASYYRAAIETAARQHSPMLEFRALADAAEHGLLPEGRARLTALRGQIPLVGSH